MPWLRFLYYFCVLMIKIEDKKDCCGCGACAQICPRKCIEMRYDEEGFAYACVDEQSCINCSLCEQVCPVINSGDARQAISVKAVKSTDDNLRKVSSSSGLFTLLSRVVLSRGGVVYGACYNADGDVVHAVACNEQELAQMRGSKYAQSNVSIVFADVERRLKEGVEVLFSGTPCQVHGLRRYLRRDYDNLIVVDVVCHGVPSPMVWRNYLKDINPDGLRPLYINMRQKSRWNRSYSIKVASGGRVLVNQLARHNVYMQAFRKDYTLRPSCYECAAKGGRSQSDITIGDLWGARKIVPRMADHKGLNAALVWSEKGARLMDQIGGWCAVQEVTLEAVLRRNGSIVNSAKMPAARADFWTKYEEQGVDAIELFAPIKYHNPFVKLYYSLKKKAGKKR